MNFQYITAHLSIQCGTFNRDYTSSGSRWSNLCRFICAWQRWNEFISLAFSLTFSLFLFRSLSLSFSYTEKCNALERKVKSDISKEKWNNHHHQNHVGRDLIEIWLKMWKFKLIMTSWFDLINFDFDCELYWWTNRVSRKKNNTDWTCFVC